MQADLKIQYRISATVTGSTFLKKNALIVSLLGIGKISFHNFIIQDAGICGKCLSDKELSYLFFNFAQFLCCEQ